MKELENKTLIAIAVNQDQSVIRFETDEGFIYYKTYADCCSETWFADILFSQRRDALPRKVKNVEELEMPMWAERLADRDGRTRQEHDEIYGYRITTESGLIEIIYRNSSNGYYGGSCQFLPLHKVNNHDVFIGVNEDWSA